MIAPVPKRLGHSVEIRIRAYPHTCTWLMFISGLAMGYYLGGLT